MTVQKRKLIEVSMPLEVINRESSREKAIRHGHPSTLHLWWARRPLSACRVVLFASLVDDPTSHPDQFPTIDTQVAERNRLLQIVEKLATWEATTDITFLKTVHAEIAKSCPGGIPEIFDPFAGGGSIPLEAQRLGLSANASDLNPISVFLNMALIDFPLKWTGKSPISPDTAEAKLDWPNASGLAADIKFYGEQILEEVKKRIGHLYPEVQISKNVSVPVVAWIWTRTVTCPNPACGIAMPLVRSFWLRNDKNKKVWVKPIHENGSFAYQISEDKRGPSIEGTVGRNGAICLACNSSVPLKYIREAAKSTGLGVSLMAVIGVGNKEKIYFAPSDLQKTAAKVKTAEDIPLEQLPINPRDFKTPNYGLTTFASLFTDRQLVALTTFSKVIKEIRSTIVQDAEVKGYSKKDAAEYGRNLNLYLTLALGRCADYNSTICTWIIGGQTIRNTFARQAIPMTWDFAETNIIGGATGNWTGQINWISKVIENLIPGIPGKVKQLSAQSLVMPINSVVSTDPPYYDNIGYADLSDYFYVWLRRNLRDDFPELLGTVMTPKSEELVATPYRFGGDKKVANKFFEDGFVETFSNIRKYHDPDIPMTVFYAFKQTEEDESGNVSTGWETMLNAILQSGFSINATWPIRTELSTRMLGSGTNALASSIVLACRVKSGSEEATTRRNFISLLKSELPLALKALQQANIAPVDLAQAAIGPGMAIFSRYTKVIEADGSDMTVRTSLALINQVLDEVLSEQEGDFDPETRFCIKWFSQFGWNNGLSGEADVLSRAVNTSLAILERGGVFKAVAGKAALVAPQDMSKDWDPLQDKTISIWEVALRIAYALQNEGLQTASQWSLAASARVDLESVKELAYLLFSICEKKGWTESAILFNGLGTSWSDLKHEMQSAPKILSEQSLLDFDGQE